MHTHTHTHVRQTDRYRDKERQLDLDKNTISESAIHSLLSLVPSLPTLKTWEWSGDEATVYTGNDSDIYQEIDSPSQPHPT